MSSHTVKAIKPAVRRLVTTYNPWYLPYPHGDTTLPPGYDLCDTIKDSFWGLSAIGALLTLAWSSVHLGVWLLTGEDIFPTAAVPAAAVLTVAVCILFTVAIGYLMVAVDRLASNTRLRLPTLHWVKPVVAYVRQKLCVPVDLG